MLLDFLGDNYGFSSAGLFRTDCLNKLPGNFLEPMLLADFGRETLTQPSYGANVRPEFLSDCRFFNESAAASLPPSDFLFTILC